MCDCSRTTIYAVLARDKDPCLGLENRSSRPLSNCNQTNSEIENLVVQMRKQSNFGSRRISVELARNKGVKTHKNTVYKILKRNGVNFRKKRKSKNNDLRDYYQSPFRFIEIDIKEVKDTKALPQEVYEQVDKYNLPHYQFTATDTFTRMRWLGYGYEKSFTNGFGFLFYTMLQLRQAGITEEIIFQTDNGQEFGGFEEKKIKQLDEELKLFNCRFIHIPKAQKHKQGHVERSHRSDDEELYIPYLTTAKDTKSFIELAGKWVWYFNVKRPHQGKYLNDSSPFEYAQRLQDEGYQKEVKVTEFVAGKEITKLDENGYEMTEVKRFYLPKGVNLDKLKLIPVLLLDNVSVELMFYYNKLLNSLRKKKQSQVSLESKDSLKSVQEVCGCYLLHNRL
jgi:transposase